MIDDTYLTTQTKQSQSYASILDRTTIDTIASCGGFAINWYQTTPNNPTLVSLDRAVFSHDKFL